MAGGYRMEIVPADNLEEIRKSGFRCAFCLLLLKDPTQLSCGNRGCRTCARLTLSAGEPGLCPTCEKEDPENKYHIVESEIIPDNFCRRQIEKLIVRCEHHVAGCSWTGKLACYDDHLATECQYARDGSCESCGATVSQGQLTKHMQEDCPNRTSEAQALELSLDTDPRQCGACKRNIASLEHVEHICSRVNAIEESTKRVSDLSLVPTSLSPPPDSDIAHLGNKLKGNTNLITVLYNEIKLCSHQLLSDQELSRGETNALKERVVALETVTSSLKLQYQDLSRKVEEMRLTTTDGTLVWPIYDVETKQRRARSGEVPAVYSPPFFTTPSGYKLRSRVYLNGDGMGKDSHVSLFVMVMKGPYDAILKWPFPYRITLMLLDQSGNENHIKETFRADPNSSSFQRPRNEDNIATGCPRFISLADLERRWQLYVRNNVMFIKIIVDVKP